jgi:two-component system chemotaxis sensor kinase CheA
MNKAKYLDLFIEESQENMEGLTHNLLALRDNAEDKKRLKEAFRQAHTIKGTAAMMGFDQIAEVASRMENGLLELGQNQLEIGVKMASILCRDLNTLKLLLEDVARRKESPA